MSEGIDIYNKGRPRDDSKARMAMNPKGFDIRAAVVAAGKSFVGKVFTLSTKRKTIDVKIDRDSIAHIANSIKNGYIPLRVADVGSLNELIHSATWHSSSEADSGGKHAKHHSSHFHYFMTPYDGHPLYLNVQGINKTINRRQITEWRLYDITKSIKQ